jgi:predicted NUDIX family NTP pyrophosphohydrolase
LQNSHYRAREIISARHEAMRRNAGILMYKYYEDELLVLFVRPGRSVLGEKGPWKLVHPEGGI